MKDLWGCRGPHQGTCPGTGRWIQLSGRVGCPGRPSSPRAALLGVMLEDTELYFKPSGLFLGSPQRWGWGTVFRQLALKHCLGKLAEEVLEHMSEWPDRRATRVTSSCGPRSSPDWTRRMRPQVGRLVSSWWNCELTCLASYLEILLTGFDSPVEHFWEGWPVHTGNEAGERGSDCPTRRQGGAWL